MTILNLNKSQNVDQNEILLNKQFVSIQNIGCVSFPGITRKVHLVVPTLINPITTFLMLFIFIYSHLMKTSK